MDDLIIGVCGGMMLDSNEDDDEDETLSYTAESITQPPYDRREHRKRVSREERYGSNYRRGRDEAQCPVEDDYHSHKHKKPKTLRTGHYCIMTTDRGPKYVTSVPRYDTGYSKYYYDRAHRLEAPYHGDHVYPSNMEYDSRDDSRQGSSSRRYIEDDFDVEVREPYAHYSMGTSHDRRHKRHGGKSCHHCGSGSTSKKRSKFRLFGRR